MAEALVFTLVVRQPGCRTTHRRDPLHRRNLSSVEDPHPRLPSLDFATCLAARELLFKATLNSMALLKTRSQTLRVD